MREKHLESTSPSILLVDDYAENLRLLVQILQKEGYKVHPLRDGQAALRLASSRPPDLILLDIMMPLMDGYEVCKRLKANNQTRDIPVIFVSALDEVFDKVKAFSVGGVDYITKPIQPEEVLARVKTHLAIHNLQTQLESQNTHLHQEITARKEMEDALFKSRRLLKNVFTSLEEAVIVVDRSTNAIVLCNEAVEKLFGYRQEDVLGQGFECLWRNKEEYKLLKKDILHTLDAGEIFFAESQMSRKDGSLFIGEHKTSAITSPDDQIVAMIHIVRDITERKLSEEALQQHNRELSLLNRIGHMVISSLELNHVLETALAELQQLLKVVSASFWLMAPNTDELRCMHAIGPGSKTLIEQRLEPGRGITGWVFQHGESALVADVKTDARHFDKIDEATGQIVRSMLSVPLLLKGNVIGVLNLADFQENHFTQQDLQLAELIASTAAIAIENARLYATAQQEIAERKQAEKALQQANDRLKLANDSKDKFFSIISHDLRSPFSVLMGYTELISLYFEEYSREKLKSEIDKLHITARRLYALLENLLTWSRIQRGVMPYNPEILDIQKRIESIIELFFSKAKQKQISLVHSRQNVPQVYADENMVNTILRNLVSNALKFTDDGGTISLFTQQRDDMLEIAISDTGLGIRPDDISKLFRIDVQFSNAGTDGERGTGLGLNLCQDLVQRNGGDIWVESKVGQGTIFTFTLPLSSVKRKKNDE